MIKPTNYRINMKLLGLLCACLITSGCNQASTDTPLAAEPETGQVENKQTDEGLSSSEKIVQDNLIYLEREGVTIEKKEALDEMNGEDMLGLLAEAYESIIGPIDSSFYHTDSPYSEGVKKMTMLEVIDNYYVMPESELDMPVNYGAASYWLMTLQDVIQDRQKHNQADEATPEDLLNRINVTHSLYLWSEVQGDITRYELDELVEEKVAVNQPLTKLTAAEMMVRAYEDNIASLEPSVYTELTDTDNIYSQKAVNTFHFTEDGLFHPEQTGHRDDWGFMSAINYDEQVRSNLTLDMLNIPFGAAISAVTALVKTYKDETVDLPVETIVYTENSDFWHVYQYETREYGDVNCMPAVVEMALRFQGQLNHPTTEELRNEYPEHGQGWTDGVAETAMTKYGVHFEDSWDIDLETMTTYLDKGDLLYVMYFLLEEMSIGHAVLIKGYWQIGNQVNFIIADPSINEPGLFGNIDAIIEAEKMMEGMSSHVPRYFIIKNQVEQL